MPGRQTTPLLQQARERAQYIKTSADILLTDVQTGNYSEAPKQMVEIYAQLTNLRPIIDTLLGGKDENRWGVFRYSCPECDSGLTAFISGLFIGVIVTFYLIHNGIL